MFECPLDGKSFDETRTTVCPQCGTDYSAYFLANKVLTQLSSYTKKTRKKTLSIACVSALGAASIILALGRTAKAPIVDLTPQAEIDLGNSLMDPVAAVAGVTNDPSGRGIFLPIVAPTPDSSPSVASSGSPTPSPISYLAAPSPIASSISGIEIEPKSRARIHIVQPNEFLTKIANMYYGDGGKYTIIIKANLNAYPGLEINPDLIRPGWILRIPTLDRVENSDE